MQLHNKQFLTQNLCFVYRLMVASAPLLEFAISKSAGNLREYYKHHLEQERGHDEMLARDLRGLNVFTIPHFRMAAQAAGSQYYYIAHDDPALLLGYMYVLEHAAPKPDHVAALEQMHGVSLSCMRHHAAVDEDHVKELVAAIEELPTEVKTRVLDNGVMVTNLLQIALNQIWADIYKEQ